MVDPIEDDYDLVIRVNPPPDDRLVGHRFLHDRRLIVAHTDVPMPQSSDEKKGTHPIRSVLLSATPADVTWRFRSDSGTEIVLQPEPVLRLSSLLMVRDAVLAGGGVELLPELLVAGDVEAGRLALWGPLVGPPVELWALQSSRRLVAAKVRAFLDVVHKASPEKRFVQPG